MGLTGYVGAPFVIDVIGGHGGGGVCRSGRRGVGVGQPCTMGHSPGTVVGCRVLQSDVARHEMLVLIGERHLMTDARSDRCPAMVQGENIRTQRKIMRLHI